FKMGSAASAIVNACFVASAASFSCSCNTILSMAVKIAIAIAFVNTRGNPVKLTNSIIKGCCGYNTNKICICKTGGKTPINNACTGEITRDFEKNRSEEHTSEL